jgi:hypothetical protein
MTERTAQIKTICFRVLAEDVKYNIPWCEWLQMSGSDIYNKYYDAVQVSHLLGGIHELSLDTALLCVGEKVLTIPCACTPTSHQAIKHESAMTEYIHINRAQEEKKVLDIRVESACHTNDASHAYSRSHQRLAAEQHELIRLLPKEMPIDVWEIVTEYAGRPVPKSHHDLFYQDAVDQMVFDANDLSNKKKQKKRKRLTTSRRETTLIKKHACCACHAHDI